MKVLTIISHTEHYKLPDGSIAGLGSTVTEINHLIRVFDRINHIAMLHEVSAPASALPYTSSNIRFIPIKAVGGKALSDKLIILTQAPKVLKTINKILKESDCFQFRAPTGIGVYVIPYLWLFNRKKGWFKYAGNWNQNNAPLAYKFQKWLLTRQSRKVTINGSWPNQAQHCLTFENPCLSAEDIHKGELVARDKNFNNGQLNFCFVGRLEEAKGIELLIEAFNNLTELQQAKISNIHIVGDGKDIATYIERSKKTKLNFVFHGFLSRASVHDIYAKSHFIVLPSASEGFPKVIAEALNYGCVPIVSNVSGISNYIKDDQNGFLLNTISVDGVLEKLTQVLNLTEKQYLERLKKDKELIKKFTFDYYNTRVQNELIV